MEIIEKTGVLASLTWNSNRWKGEPTEEDLKSSKFDHVRDYAEAHESLNFAHDLLPAEKGDWFVGYSPSLKDRFPKGDGIKTVFLISTDHARGGTRYVVGIYGLPEFNEYFERTKRLHPLYKKYDGGTFRSKKEDIVLLDNYLPIDPERVQKRNLIPRDKQISHMGWNYLNSDNVENLFEYALSKNPNHVELKALMKKLGLGEIFNENNLPQGIIDENDDDTYQYQGKEGREKFVLHRSKERDRTLILKFKKWLLRTAGELKCEVCQMSFEKVYGKNLGSDFIEAHHKTPIKDLDGEVETKFEDLAAVCSNCHRMLHRGERLLTVEQLRQIVIVNKHSR